MQVDRNGMRLKVTAEKILVGPLTNNGALTLSYNLSPYTDPAATWISKLQAIFGVKLPGTYKVVYHKKLDDGTLIVAELTRETQINLDVPEKFHPFL